MRKFIQRGVEFIAVLNMLFGVLPASAGEQAGLLLVRVQLHWMHQAQFAGLYVGNVK